jgi:thiol:disulfide interchange protein
MRCRCVCAVLFALVAGGTLVPAAHAQDAIDPATAVQVRAVPQTSVARPGDPVAVAVEITYADGFHSWPHTPVVPPEFGADFPAIPTTIDVTGAPSGTQVGSIQWPEPTPVTVYYTMAPVPLLSYHGKVVAYVPVVLPPDLRPGDVAIELKVAWQACDQTTCYFPQDKTVSVPLKVVAAGEQADATPNEPGLFADFDVAGFNITDASGVAAGRGTGRGAPIAFDVFGHDLAVDPYGPVGLGLLLLLAALGGLLLNFTPCVLPIIPLKVMGLSRAAGNPGRLLRLGVAMSLGVVAFWLVLGGAISFIAGFDAISTLFQTGWFAFVVGLVVGVMALGMFGVWEFTLPQSVYRVRADQETYHGSFLYGIMTAVLSTPCTAPFMGAAAAWAATQAAGVTMATFAAIGIGMAVPYLLLSARPQLLSRLPRSGPGSVVLKQVMGLLMLAVAAFFLGLGLSSALQQPPDPPSRFYWWVVAAFIVAAFGWSAVKVFALTSSKKWRVLTVVVAVLVSLATLALVRDVTGHGPIAWTYYTPERFEQAVQAGDVVVLDFTAEWCLNCRALEQAVLNQPEVAAMLNSDGIVPMRVDLTGDNPAGKAKLKELQWLGIPLLAIVGPGLGYDKALKYDTYTPQVVLDAIRKVRGGAANGGGSAPTGR